MHTFSPYLRGIIGMFICCLCLSNPIYAQSEEKPELEFDAQLDIETGTLEVTWAQCLENSVLTLLDSDMYPIKVTSMCQGNENLDVSAFMNKLRYVKVEHYTGSGVKTVEQKPRAVEEEE